VCAARLQSNRGDFVATPPAAMQPGIYPPLADGNLIAAITIVMAAWWLKEPPPHCAFGTMSHEHFVLVVISKMFHFRDQQLKSAAQT